MRILLVSSGYPPQIGGVERHVAGLARAFTQLGHDVDVVTHAGMGQPTHRTHEDIDVASYRSVGSGPALRVSLGLWRDLRARVRDYDVVHVHNYHATPALAAALARPHLLVFTPHYHGTGHSPLLTLLHHPYRIAGRWLLAHCDAVICVTAQEAARLEADFPSVGPRPAVIPNGIDLTRRTVCAPASSPRPDRRLILSVGRLERHKNVRALVAALPLMPDDFVLSIIGEGPDHDDLAARVEALKLTGRVEFRGRVSDDELDQAYGTATVVATVSGAEAYGIVLAEALARGCRVVASDIPAHREVAEMSGAVEVEFVAVTVGPRELAAALRSAAGRPVPDRLPTFMSEMEVATATLDVYTGVSRHVRP